MTKEQAHALLTKHGGGEIWKRNLGNHGEVTCFYVTQNNLGPVIAWTNGSGMTLLFSARSLDDLEGALK